MCFCLLTPAAADAPIVTPIVDRVLVPLIAEIKASSIDTAVAVAVRGVMVVVDLEGYESRHVFWIGFGEGGKRRSHVF